MELHDMKSKAMEVSKLLKTMAHPEKADGTLSIG